jgi:hypothetical protein
VNQHNTKIAVSVQNLPLWEEVFEDFFRIALAIEKWMRDDQS